METITRRTFLRQGASGATAFGAFAALSRLPLLSGRRRGAAVHETGVARPAGTVRDGVLVVHIPDQDSGNLHLLFGTREVVRHDPALIARLVRATH